MSAQLTAMLDFAGFAVDSQRQTGTSRWGTLALRAIEHLPFFVLESRYDRASN